MNYPNLQQYLKDKVLKIEITNGNWFRSSKETIELRKEFLIANRLTETPQLTQALISFYQSVTATINKDRYYFRLLDYEDLTTRYHGQFFATQKPGLGNQVETTIADEHYRLIDKIIADYQKTQEKPKSQQEEEISAEVLNLQVQAQAIQNRMRLLLLSENLKNTDDPNEYFQIIKNALGNSSEGQTILAEIQQWLTDYQQLTSGDQQLLKQQFTSFDGIDKAKSDQDEEDNEQEATAKPTKEENGNKESLLYLGGFILVSVIVFFLVKRE